MQHNKNKTLTSATACIH